MSVPKITLENFEDEFTRETPYILTSPTSLRACSKLLIEPSELVYRSLEEYEETLNDLSLAEIYRIYENNETERQEKILKARELRKAFKLNEIEFPKSRIQIREEDMSPFSGKTGRSSRTSRKEASSSVSKVKISPEFYGSDTESQDDHHPQGGEHLEPSFPRPRSKKGSKSKRIYSTKSVPDLPGFSSRSNIDFRKTSPFPLSPRHYCHCQWDWDDRKIFGEYMNMYGDILAHTELSSDDRKILELLILKKGRQMEWDKKSHELRKAIELDRVTRMKERQLFSQKWQDRLMEKRKRENLENMNRYLAIQKKGQDNRLGLINHLEDRDRRVRRYLDDLEFQRRTRLLAKQKQEAHRQEEVGRAIERLLEQDRIQREALAEKLENRMTEAEQRKRRKENDYWRHIQEMNQLEDVKRELKMERLDQQSREYVESLKNQLEDKDHRAQLNHLSHLRLRQAILSTGAGNRKKALEKAQRLHTELLEGLEEWHRKVLHLQLAAQERASSNYNCQMSRRRARMVSERLLREGRSLESLKRIHEVQEQRRELVQSIIESKETRTERVRRDKERRIQISRLRAQQAAELRHELKEKLDPDTFDKKAARVELELRFLKKTPVEPFIRYDRPVVSISSKTKGLSISNIGLTRPRICTCLCQSKKK